jgi:putative DNA primase/helicase
VKSDTFEIAQRAVSRGLIESLAPGGHWEGDDWKSPSPLRSDSDSSDSFHIFDHAGVWMFKDFVNGEGGDVIKLYSLVKGGTLLDAAKAIAGEPSGPELARKKKSKVVPIIPIPEDAARALGALAKASPIGKVVKGWRYYRALGEWAFSVVRYETAEGKTIRPYQWTAEGWREGMPIASGRPLYHLPELLAAPDLPVLVVEGEKCADIAVPGWVLVSWSSGASSVDKTDWSPLIGRSVTIWPDNDEPGMKAALAIRNRLPGARILDVGAEVSA